VADLFEQFLDRHVLRQALAERSEEVGLFDVFFFRKHDPEP
jgi:hypothetical protein